MHVFEFYTNNHLMSSKISVKPPLAWFISENHPNCRFIAKLILLLQHVSVNTTLNLCSSSPMMAYFACDAAPSLMRANDACSVPWHRLRPNRSCCSPRGCGQHGSELVSFIFKYKKKIIHRAEDLCVLVKSMSSKYSWCLVTMFRWPLSSKEW